MLKDSCKKQRNIFLCMGGIFLEFDLIFMRSILNFRFHLIFCYG